MSSSPECRKCGDQIHHGPVLCEHCDMLDAIEREHRRICRAIGHYAEHAPIDLKSPSEIQRDLRAICGERHYHVASIGSDECDLCGRDLRNEVHISVAFRTTPAATE